MGAGTASRRALLLAAGLAAAPPAAAQIRFEDVAGRAGVGHVVRNSETPERYQIEPMIAGVALFDFDNDGRLDVFFCNGATIPGLEKSDGSFSNRLYRNGPGLVFEDVTARAGVAGAGYSMGATAGDFDNDGWADLYVTGVDRNTLYRNRGDGTFEDVTASAGVAGERPGEARPGRSERASSTTTVTGTWTSSSSTTACGASRRTRCAGPRRRATGPTATRTRTSPSPTSSTGTTATAPSPTSRRSRASGRTWAREWAWPSPTTTPTGGWTPSSRTTPGAISSSGTAGTGPSRRRGSARGWPTWTRGGRSRGWGPTSRTTTATAWLDIFMTALSNETFPLFRNEGNGMFREETFASRLGGQSLAWGGWSTGMVDLDNDGFLDLFVAGGHVQPNEELYSSRSSRQSNRVFRKIGHGTFGDVTRACGADFQQLGLHRGAAFGDLDDDGRVDAVVTRLNEPVEVFLNRAEPSGHYLLVRCSSARAPTGTAWARPSASSSARDGRWSACVLRRRLRRLQRQAGALRTGGRRPDRAARGHLAERPAPGRGEPEGRPGPGGPGA